MIEVCCWKKGDEVLLAANLWREEAAIGGLQDFQRLPTGFQAHFDYLVRKRIEISELLRSG